MTPDLGPAAQRMITVDAGRGSPTISSTRRRRARTTRVGDLLDHVGLLTIVFTGRGRKKNPDDRRRRRAAGRRRAPRRRLADAHPARPRAARRGLARPRGVDGDDRGRLASTCRARSPASSRSTSSSCTAGTSPAPPARTSSATTARSKPRCELLGQFQEPGQVAEPGGRVRHRGRRRRRRAAARPGARAQRPRPELVRLTGLSRRRAARESTRTG